MPTPLSGVSDEFRSPDSNRPQARVKTSLKKKIENNGSEAGVFQRCLCRYRHQVRSQQKKDLLEIRTYFF